MNRRVAARYAQALMDLGEGMKVLDKLAEDLRDIEQTAQASRELKVFLLSPVATPDQKLRILNELFGKRSSELTMKFIALLVRKGRSEYLLATAEEFLRMLDAKRNILHARIESATQLTDAEQMQLMAKLERMTGKRIRADFTLDPSLRGGFIARMGDEMIDASLKHQLAVLREQFMQGGAPILN
ncbi:MAG TPA: ATP synthase F1 subunit delta [Candidatus Kapabacteria bacterium]|nr:ATP synthase F1 subunit delta [Candidatus Kapabacteria bacterium]